MTQRRSPSSTRGRHAHKSRKDRWISKHRRKRVFPTYRAAHIGMNMLLLIYPESEHHLSVYSCEHTDEGWESTGPRHWHFGHKKRGWKDDSSV